MTYSVWWITVISDAENCLAYTQRFNPTVFWEREPVIATAKEDHCACGWRVTSLPCFEKLDLSLFAFVQSKAASIILWVGMVVPCLLFRCPCVGSPQVLCHILGGSEFQLWMWRTEIFLALPLPKSIGEMSLFYYLFKNSMDLKGPSWGREGCADFCEFFTYSCDGGALNVFPWFWSI